MQRVSPTRPPTTTRSASSRALVAWLVRLMLCVAVVLMLGGVALAGPLEDTVVRLEAEERATLELVVERNALEATHRELSARIEALKAEGSLVDDYALQDALRQARASAEALNELAERIRIQQEREGKLRQQVVDQYDALIVRLESRLLEVDASEQAQLIARLEALQLAREDFRRALSVAPDPFVAVAIPDLDGLDGSDPEELVAAADELADNEQKLRGQLGELESRINALERRRRLVAFAEDSADEANLFGEEARSTRVSSASSRSSGDAASETPTSGNDSTGGGTQNEQEPTAGAPSGDDLTASPTPDNEGAAPPESPDPASNFDSDGSEGRIDSPVLDDRGGAPGSSDLGSAPGLPPTSSGGQGGVIRSDADPAVIAGGGRAGSGGNLDAELRRLKSQRKRLEGDLDRVGKKQKELRKRARQVGGSR